MTKKNFKINKNIYWEKYIKEAIEDYKDIAKISYKDGEIIIEWDSDLDEIFNELMNYVISIQNEQI